MFLSADWPLPRQYILGGHFCLSFQMVSHLAAVAGLELISLTMLTLNLWQSHLILLSAGNTGVPHHAQLIFYLCRFFVVLGMPLHPASKLFL